jgi:hypothetical protein
MLHGRAAVQLARNTAGVAQHLGKCPGGIAREHSYRDIGGEVDLTPIRADRHLGTLHHIGLSQAMRRRAAVIGDPADASGDAIELRYAPTADIPSEDSHRDAANAVDRNVYVAPVRADGDVVRTGVLAVTQTTTACAPMASSLARASGGAAELGHPTATAARQDDQGSLDSAAT